MLLTTPGAPRAPALGLRKGADFCVSSRHAATIMNQGKAPAIRFTSPRTNASLAFIYLTDLVIQKGLVDLEDRWMRSSAGGETFDESVPNVSSAFEAEPTRSVRDFPLKPPPPEPCISWAMPLFTCVLRAASRKLGRWASGHAGRATAGGKSLASNFSLTPPRHVAGRPQMHFPRR